MNKCIVLKIKASSLCVSACELMHKVACLPLRVAVRVTVL